VPTANGLTMPEPVFRPIPDPLEGHGVVLSHVAAFHQDRLAVLHVNPVVGHPPPKRGPQTGDRGAVSKSGVLDVSQAEQPSCLLEGSTPRSCSARRPRGRSRRSDWPEPPCRRPSRWRSRSRRVANMDMPLTHSDPRFTMWS